MRKLVATLLLLSTFILPVKAADWTLSASRLAKSIVFVSSGDGVCTGFVINTQKHYVLTASHCVDEKMAIDHVAANLVAVDRSKDLAVYEVPELDKTRPALMLALGDPKIGQSVLSGGFGDGLSRPMFRHTMIAENAMTVPDVDHTMIGVDSVFVGGQSGGPVINAQNEVVMIVQATTEAYGIGTGAKQIRESVGRFWGK